MTIKVRKEGSNMTVETDRASESHLHEMVHSDPDIRGAMATYGIKEVEAPSTLMTYSSLRDTIDEKVKEKTGHYHFKY